MNTAVFKETVTQLDEQLDKLLAIAESTGTQQDVVEQVLDLKEKNQGKDFKVLVMGEFSTGKSTMINALIGEPILPEKAVTATAIITEIKYGEEKKAVIYPIPGKWKGGDEPFEVPVTELKKYLLINHNIKDAKETQEEINHLINGIEDREEDSHQEGNVIASPFEKAEIFLPLDILKDGVEIIDSPGLNDPASHGDITHNYLPNAHAIIFCMSGHRAYSLTEKETLEKLNSMRYTTPIFVVTYFDQICANIDDGEREPDEVEHEIDQFKRTVCADISKHTDLVNEQYTSLLGGNGIFFVSSRDAKKAKHSDPWNDELYEQSGYKAFESYLSDYLVKCKGSELSKMIVEGIRVAGVEATRSLEEQYSAADLSLEEFEQRMEEVQAKMESARAQADLFVKSFDIELAKVLSDLKTTCRQLPKDAFAQVDSWKSSYKCSVKQEVLHPKRTAEAIAKEFEMHMQNQYESFALEWSENVLKPEVTAKMKAIGEKLEGRAKDLDATINDIKTGLNLTHSSPDELSSTTSKVVSVVYGLFTGDVIGASSGVAVGMDGLIQGIIANIGVNVVLLAIFGSTVGLPLIIAGEIVQVLISGTRNKEIIKKKVCNKIVEQYKKVLSEPQEVDKLVDNMYSQLQEQFATLSDGAKKATFSDIEKIQLESEQLLEDKKNGEQAINERKENIRKWISEINEIVETSYNIRNNSLA